MISPTPKRVLAPGRLIDYTDVRKDITVGDVEALCMEASAFTFRAVVVPSALVATAIRSLAGRVAVSCPIAYPFGTQSASVKAAEAEAAVAAGATELEVVPHFGTLRAGRWRDSAAELDAIARASRGATLKLVLEASVLDADTIRKTCILARDAGFTFVTHTIGFRLVSTLPETVGSLSVDAVRRLAHLAGSALQVKAFGGSCSFADVEALHSAGAERVAVLAERGLFAAALEGGTDEPR